MQRLILFASLLLALAVQPAPAASAEGSGTDLTDSARRVFETHKSSVVAVGALMNLDLGMMGGTQEQDVELTGTVVDDSGLTVISKTALNPFGDESLTVEPQPGLVLEISARVEQIWFEREDGTRLHAEIVLQDADLDVSLIRPVNQDDVEPGSFSPVALNRAAAQASVLDQVIILGRLGIHGRRGASVEIQRVRAVIERPRLSYEVGSAVGSAVFDTAGQLLGVTVNTQNRERGFDPEDILMGGPAGVGLPVVVPASAIVPIIKQAQGR